MSDSTDSGRPIDHAGHVPQQPAACRDADRRAGPDNVTQLRPATPVRSEGALTLHEASLVLAYVRRFHADQYAAALAYAVEYLRDR